MKYPIYIEKDANSDYGVTVPDIPGCFSAGVTYEEAVENAEEAILTHVEGLFLDNEAIPNPSSIEALKDVHKTDPKVLWALVSVDFSRLSKETKRINVTLPENILTKIDSFSKRKGQTRSGLLATAAIEYISRHSL